MKNTIVTSHCFSSTSLDSADFMIECMHCNLVTLINIQLDIIASIDSSLLLLSFCNPASKTQVMQQNSPYFYRPVFVDYPQNKANSMADISAIRNLANEGISMTKDVMEKMMKSVRGNDKRFFNSSKKGEVGEWKKKLHSLDVTEVTNAMKCVIAAMTIGTDVSMLFPDVISCIHDKTLELKKLVYLCLCCR